MKAKSRTTLWIGISVVLAAASAVLIFPSYQYLNRQGHVIVSERRLWRTVRDAFTSGAFCRGERWHVPGQERSIDPIPTSLVLGPEIRVAIPWTESPYDWSPSPTVVEEAFLSTFNRYGDLRGLGVTIHETESTNDAVRRVARSLMDRYCSYNEEKKRLQNTPSESAWFPASKK
jgi:hypothetical protein